MRDRRRRPKWRRYTHSFFGREGNSSAVSTLGYVEKAGREREAIVEVLDQVFLVHEGELFAEKYRALQVTPSSAAAQAMHMPSTAQVRPEILGFGAGGAIQGIFAVQVGAFRDRGNAERLKERIESQFRPVIIQGFERGDGLFYRVRVGHESTEDAARTLRQSLRRANLVRETFVVRLSPAGIHGERRTLFSLVEIVKESTGGLPCLLNPNGIPSLFACQFPDCVRHLCLRAILLPTRPWRFARRRVGRMVFVIGAERCSIGPVCRSKSSRQD